MTTKKYKKKMMLFIVLSVLSWLATFGVLVMTGVNFSLNPNPEVSSITTSLIDIFMPLAVTFIITLIVVFFIREKLRNTFWLANVLLASLFFSPTVIYIVLALYAIDEFILLPMYRRYRSKYLINAELDHRIGKD